jgi:glycosyltransferase involved in cell wall biosynthesis
VYRDLKVAAVVPAYCEEEHIARVIETMPDSVDIIVVVDDCSPDATYERAVAVHDQRLTVLRLEENQGVGGAIMAGHTAALQHGSDVNVIFAGDGQMDPAYLPDLLDPIVDDGYGFTKANRFYSSKSFKGMPLYRIIGNIILSFMNKLASGYWNLFDPQNGYTATKASVLRRLDFDRIAKRYEFENDFLMNLNILNVRARDVPIPALYGDETSTIKLRKVIPALLRLMTRGFFRRVMLKYVIGTFSPIALFLAVGALLVSWSFFFGLWVLYESIGPPEASTGTVLLCVAPGLVGIQLLISALQMDIQATPS